MTSVTEFFTSDAPFPYQRIILLVLIIAVIYLLAVSFGVLAKLGMDKMDSGSDMPVPSKSAYHTENTASFYGKTANTYDNAVTGIDGFTEGLGPKSPSGISVFPGLHANKVYEARAKGRMNLPK